MAYAVTSPPGGPGHGATKAWFLMLTGRCERAKTGDKYKFDQPNDHSREKRDGHISVGLQLTPNLRMLYNCF
jgi:hypothetical protein